MEMTSSVMRFALATYFMKRGGSSRPPQPCYGASPSYEPSIAASYVSEEEDESQESPLGSHMSNFRQLLVKQRFHAADTEALRSLGPMLVKVIKRQEEQEEEEEEDAACSVQVIEHMCFEKSGEPSEVFDQLVELLFEALSHCCEEKGDTGLAIWLLHAVDAVMHGLQQYHERQFGKTNGRPRNWEETTNEMIRACLASSVSAAAPSTAEG